jgi:enoyl-CoA hydratase/carnithine racemase
MPKSTVRVDHHGPVAVITLDRPDRRNALTETTWAALDDAIASLEARLPRAVIITGAGDRAFSAGMDVSPDNPQNVEMAKAVGDKDVALAEALLGRLRAVFDRLVALPVPVIAAVNGLAFGGGAELAARCDLRVADPAAIFCFSEVRLGLMPDLGGGVALTRLIGPGRAADLILTARRVDAREALALGLVNRISAPGGALDAALELGRAIAANGPRAVRSSLEIIRRTPDLPAADALALEIARAAALIASGECAAGIQAFFTKTEPVFLDP